MKLYIVRHGETDWNRERRVQGHADIPLNDYGRYLARETAKGLQQVNFDAAYTSPLIRAKETAQIILQGKPTPLFEDEQIKELAFGNYEGMHCGKDHDSEAVRSFDKFFTDPANYIPDGGETLETLLTRTNTFLQKISATHQNQTILITTHGAALNAMINNLRHNQNPATFWNNTVQPNCGVTIVQIKNATPKILQEGIVYYKDPIHSWQWSEH